MLLKVRKGFCIYFTGLMFSLVIGCRVSARAIISTSNASSGVMPTKPIIQQEVVISGIDIVDFGWTENNDIYYGVGGDPTIDSAETIIDMDETTLYVYDVEGKTYKLILISS